MFELRDVEVEFKSQFRTGRHEAPRPLDGLSLPVAAGEIVAVAGSPGFGGTTIARACAGTLSIASGTIMSGGRDITNVPPTRRPVGLVPAGGGLLPQLSCRDNLTYGLRLRQAPNVDVRGRLQTLTARLELTPLLDLRPHELWADQRMRIALARALARRALDLLVVDATAGAEGLTELGDLIARGKGDEPLAVLLCTADHRVIDQAVRVAIVERGRVRFQDTPSALRHNPPNLAVAQLVYPNPTPALPAVAGEDEILFDHIRLSEGPLRLPCQHGLVPGTALVVMLTAKAVRLVPPDKGILVARIVDVESAGREVDAVLDVARQQGRWRARVNGGWARVGDSVGVRLDWEGMLTFDQREADHPLLAPTCPTVTE